MGEVCGEAVPLEEVSLQRLDFGPGQAVVPATARAGQVHMTCFGSSMVLDTIFEVGMDEDTELVEKTEGPVYGRGVDSWNTLSNQGGQVAGVDVVLSAHHLRDDRSPLGGNPQPLQPQHLQHPGRRLVGLHLAMLAAAISCYSMA